MLNKLLEKKPSRPQAPEGEAKPKPSWRRRDTVAPAASQSAASDTQADVFAELASLARTVAAQQTAIEVPRTPQRAAAKKAEAAFALRATDGNKAASHLLPAGQPLVLELELRYTEGAQWSFNTSMPPPDVTVVREDPSRYASNGDLITGGQKRTERYTWSVEAVRNAGQRFTLEAVLKSPKQVVNTLTFHISVAPTGEP